MPVKVKAAMRSLLLSTANVPATEGRKAALRFNGHGANLCFGASTFFVTPNFADTYSPLMQLLQEGPAANSHMHIDHPHDASRSTAHQITQAEPRMPPLRRMHQIGAAQPRAQAKFFLLQTELHYRYLQGLERLHIGRLSLIRPTGPRDDNLAASLQPSLAPGTADVQAPLEGQGRGFIHGHGKGHGIVGPTMRWLRNALRAGGQSLLSAVRKLRTDLLEAAASVQYESVNETGRQLGVAGMPPEPFTSKQQRQSRMDGGEDEDGSLREFVPIAPPVEQPHIERERARAATENRTPMVGADAYTRLPLTGAFQSTFPWYRQRFSFGCLGGALQPAAPTYRRDADLFQFDENGRITGVVGRQGQVCGQAEKDADAKDWAVQFAYDARNNQCSNHEHDCKETCVKYVKKKLEAKQSLRSDKCPSCRFWFFRIKQVKTKRGSKRFRRRGKPLVHTPYIEESDDRNDQHRCKVRREQPFRSASSDVGQVCGRCNMDYQFLLCAPHDVEHVEVAECAESTALTCPPVASGAGSASQPTADEATARRGTKRKRVEHFEWLSGTEYKALDPLVRATVLASFSAAFRKQYAMDFYITKYQGKPMEALTPLFQAMTSGVHRLEQQERDEEQRAQAAAPHDDAHTPSEPAAKQRKTLEGLARRARRLTIRLASMANRCYWLSATEVAVHLLTGGDCLQSHQHQRLFTRQLQWALHECKRVMNGEKDQEDCFERPPPLDAVAVQLVQTKPQTVVRRRLRGKQTDVSSHGGATQPAATQDESDAGLANDSARSQDDEGELCTGEEESGTNLASDNERSQDDEDEVCTEEDGPGDEGHRSADRQRATVEIMTTTACTTSTNAADDYAHRGRNLQAMPYYVYRMYVRRVRRGRQKAVPGGRLFEFEPHYALARSYAQRVRLDRMDVPTIDGFQCPTWTQDAEQNSMFKAMLFTTWSCRDALACGCVSNFEHLLSNGACGEMCSGAASSRKYTFKRAWRLRCSHLHTLAERAEARSVAARKTLVLADTTLFAQIKEPRAQLAAGVRIFQSVRAVSRSWANGNAWPAQALRTMLLHVHDLYPWHEQQCTLAEYCAYIARDVVAHIDLASEARVKPSVKKNEAQDDIADDDSSDGEDVDHRNVQALEFEDIGGGDAGEVVDDDEDVPVTELSAHPLRDHQQALAMAFQHNQIQELEHKLRLSHEDRALQQLDRVYGPMIREHLGFPGPLPGIASELRYRSEFDDALALQQRNVEILKKQLIDPHDDSGAAETDGAAQPAADDDSRVAEAAWATNPSCSLVPLSLAMQGPGAAAWELVTSAKCTDEQVDAVALLAQSMQRRFEARTDKTTHRLPVATAEHNHRAVWLGGGGVGKTRTLRMVVEPLAVTYFGEAGYLATAQASHAAQNLGPRGRTIHAVTGLLAHDSLQIAKLNGAGTRHPIRSSTAWLVRVG